MGGKAIRKWTDEDKAWLRSRFVVFPDTGEVFLHTGEYVLGYAVLGKPAPLFRVGPARKQYLAVSAKIGGKWTKVRLHMLVWFFAYDEQSLKMIDHVEGCPTVPYNNRIDNLRQATDKQNCANKAAKGYRSYTRADGSQWFYACITWKDRQSGKTKTKRSKLVETPEEARSIYLKWKKQRFGQFAFDGDVQVSAGGSTEVSRCKFADLIKTTRDVAKRSSVETDQRLQSFLKRGV